MPIQKDYAFLDWDGRLQFKPGWTIADDPGFFGRNRFMIEEVFPFDPKSLDSLRSMFRLFSARGIRQSEVLDFCAMAKINLDQVKAGKLGDSE